MTGLILHALAVWGAADLVYRALMWVGRPRRQPLPVTGGSVRADLLAQAERHVMEAHIEQEMGLATSPKDELEDV